MHISIYATDAKGAEQPAAECCTLLKQKVPSSPQLSADTMLNQKVQRSKPAESECIHKPQNGDDKYTAWRRQG